MPSVAKRAVQELEAAIQEAGANYKGEFSEPSFTLARFLSVLRRWAPANSYYRIEYDHAIDGDREDLFSEDGDGLKHLQGLVRALRDDYAGGRTDTFAQLVHADTFDGLLAQAEYLLMNGFKDPAAVIAGSVLEQHLRSLLQQAGGNPLDQKGRPKSAGALNDELAKTQAYTALEQKSVTAWIGIRNEAAHGHYDRYEAPQVDLMIQAIRHFTAKHPA